MHQSGHSREHDPEQQQHHDRSDVDQDLGPPDELRPEQQEDRTGCAEDDHEIQRGVDHVLAQNHRERGKSCHRAEDGDEYCRPAHDCAFLRFKTHAFFASARASRSDFP